MNQTAAAASRIAAFGRDLGPHLLQELSALYEDDQRALARAVPVSAQDIAYGPHPRHKLDLYRPETEALSPIFVFVHGGGFVRGDKGDNGGLMNTNLGRVAARAGFLGVVINYRLAPDHVWPAGAEDVAAVVAWLKENAARHGGDPARIVLCGTSAGAVHIGGYVKHVGCPQAERDISALVLLSGLYGYTQPDARDEVYYGDPALYPVQCPGDSLIEVNLPIMTWCAEHDPARFQAEWVHLNKDRLERHGLLPEGGIASGHNHYSLTMHLGGMDRRLEGEIIGFISKVCK